MSNYYYLLYTCLFYSCFSFSLSAQQVQVSAPVDLPSEVDYQLIARYDDQVLLYSKTETKFYIHSFKKGDLTQDWIKPINFERKDATAFRILPHENSFSVLYYYFRKGTTYIRGKEFNAKAETINDYEVGDFKGTFSMLDRHAISAHNKQHFLIYSPLNNGQVAVINFDVRRKKQHWKQILHPQNLNYHQHFKQLVLNNAGEVFAVYDQYNTQRHRKKHQFVLGKINLGGQIQWQNIPFYNHLSYDIHVQYDEINQQLVAAGLYAVDKSSLTNGLFYFNTNLAQAPKIHLTALEEPFMRSLTGKRKKKLAGIRNFSICQLVLRKDGGVLLVAEQRFTYESSINFYEEDKAPNQADYLYENILVASIHPSGKVYWKDVLFKSQSSENDNARHSSFFAVKTNSSIRFLYNNNISWDTSIFEYVINSTGQVQRNVVTHQERKNGLLPQLAHGLQVSSSEVIAVAERDKKLHLLKINY